MTNNAEDIRRRALSILRSLQRNVDQMKGEIPETYVREFHQALDKLEALGVDVSDFRIPDSELKRAATRISTVTFPGQSRGTEYSKERHADKPLLLTKLDSAIVYLTTLGPEAQSGVLAKLQTIFDRFQLVELQLRKRHDGRNTIKINDEHDVQDLLHALLRLFFDDIRPEESTPSYAGGSSKMDFLLKTEQVVVEVKKTRPTLAQTQIGEQLISDSAKYEGHPDCRTLVCFIYDPDHLLSNPAGLENDLTRTHSDAFSVRVFISPK